MSLTRSDLGWDACGEQSPFSSEWDTWAIVNCVGINPSPPDTLVGDPFNYVHGIISQKKRKSIKKYIKTPDQPP